MARELLYESKDGLGQLESIEGGMKLYFGDGATIAAVFADVAVGAPKGSIYLSSAGKFFVKNSVAAGTADDWDDMGVIDLADLGVGVRPVIIGIAAEDAKTTSYEENVAGLSSAITLAEALRVTTDAHAADGTEHATAADATNFPLTSPTATDLPTLLVLAGEMLTDYTAHNTDAQLGSGWAFHIAQQAGNDLVSAVTPTTLVEAITRLNDLKAKYNTHEGSATSHTAGSAHTETATDAANGVAIAVIEAGVLASDIVSWSILDSGTGTVTGVSAVAGAGEIVFTFSADPQDDAIISYHVSRAAV